DVWSDMRRQMNRFFNNFGNLFSDRRIALNKKLNENYRNAWTEFHENSNEFIIHVELPGVEKQDIQINQTDDALEIKAEKRKEKKHEDEKQGKYGYAKAYFGFSRVIDLPEEADSENIDAKYEDGVLTIKLPKKKKKNKKFIKIK
ncbi:Hsp20 family protein, partial [Candidatus Pacearchaeota archaeon]|nr:Hsp20 family protein [Candidatus Pacearchaeota archaeon]MBD3282758.1 Hsp20 family protein [Candidatus Pacearchaeota archaeon]